MDDKQLAEIADAAWAVANNYPEPHIKSAFFRGFANRVLGRYGRSPEVAAEAAMHPWTGRD